MKLHDDITTVRGVGDVVAQKLHKLHIETVNDLLLYVPRRFEDYSHVISVSKIKPGSVTIKVVLSNIKSRYSRKGLHITEATARDETGTVKVIWFNQPYRSKAIQLDKEYFVSGEFASNYKYFAISNPSCELVSDFPVNTARLVPIYKMTKGLGPATLRKIVKEVVTSVSPNEHLPEWIVKQEELIDKNRAIKEMHFPTSITLLQKAKARLGFEEVFELALASEFNKQEFAREHSYQIPFPKEAIQKFVSNLPFNLTDDQRKAAWEVFKDMEQGSPMNRLLEGDVGSGKTVVALLAALAALEAGFQVALMAPTELLANQHMKSLQEFLKHSKYADSVVLLTSSQPDKKTILSKIKSGKTQLIVGTHAIFQSAVQFHNLGLLIVDEQHRFGVEQRKKLQNKAQLMPHVLNMTATPIPRSLALTLYGEMEVSILAQKPKDRKPIKTELFISENREKVYKNLSKQLATGAQAFVVCPQIEEDDAASTKSVIKVHKDLSKKLLSEYKVGLLHGKLPSDQKAAVMQQFIDKKIDVLVSTTVIEVGVDVPNANYMVIENADNFGLAQLHQLRGRVGRGTEQAHCWLILSSNDNPSKRIQVIKNEHNGFKLAEYDLELRGPGAIYGTMQHGELDLRVAKLTDVTLIKSARSAAQKFVTTKENLVKYPELQERVNNLRSITNLN